MRFTPGQPASDFQVSDIFGKPVSLKQYAGRHLLLSFYKWASCPFCNLRVRHLSQHYPQLQQQGLDIVAVFYSSADTLRQHMSQYTVPFPLIADPQMKLYRDYGVEKSLWGMMKTSFRMGDMLEMMRLGLMKTSPEGDMRIMPADFLIAPDGHIKIAHYGSDIGDHLRLETIQESLPSHENHPFSLPVSQRG
ncbi:MAG: peroxiredoxin-like family protein [Anaerolineae bacterium]